MGKINTEQHLCYSTLVHSLPTILSALNIVADELGETEMLDRSSVVMLELATTNLSHLYADHKQHLGKFETAYNQQQASEIPFD
ncbi:TPA: hypothetical protein U1C38_001546 [Streptococcus suis]|nr:hypothetical protein [Streptococcus suis]